MNNNKRTIGLFIDNQNMRDSIMGFKEKYICEHLSKKYGKIVIGKSYWAFGRKGCGNNFPGQVAYQLFKYGIEIVPVPTFDIRGRQKNLADGKIIIDTIFYIDRYPSIDLWVIVSNDKDFIPLLEELRRRGKQVMLIHSQQIKILNKTCERLGINRIYYPDVVPRVFSPIGKDQDIVHPKKLKTTVTPI